MTKAEILRRLNMTETGMAEMFGISRSAVNQWPDNKRLPIARELQLRHELHPELFAPKQEVAA